LAKGTNFKAAFLRKKKKYSKNLRCMHVDATGKSVEQNQLAHTPSKKLGPWVVLPRTETFTKSK
tara:strand:- start:336 stop:527 length:192 start_codon:yes stop_codon:yes gene_type:complete